MKHATRVRAGGKALSFLMTAVFVLALLPLTTRAADGCSYVDENGDAQSVEATEITDSTTSLSDGWYVVDSDVTFSSTLTVGGDVKLILADGCTLTVTGSDNNAGINVASGNSLTVYCQSEGTGALMAQGDQFGAGIGGGNGCSGGTVTINGGTITANGDFGAGIGGGYGCSGGTVTINGGTINAKGFGGAGIGGGYDDGTAGTNGGTVTINGGTVTAVSEDGAGIGGGESGNGGTVMINGGTIMANGGNDGAGIGSGQDGDSGMVTINGGTVTAKGDSRGAGIGGGFESNCDTVTINGGTVTAIGGTDGVGIGGGGDDSGGYIGDGGMVTISGGSVNADVQATPTNGSENGDSAVYLAKVMLDGVNAVTPVTSLSTNVSYYGTKDIYTDDSGYLYLWLPDNVAVTVAVTTENNYGGKVSASSSGTVTGELSLMTRVEYVDADGVTKTAGTTEVTDLTGILDGETAGGWYMADGDLTLNSALTASGDVKLILADGCTLTVTGSDNNAGINVASGNSLTVYCQSEGTGALIAQGGKFGAGVGGGDGCSSGTVTINGGTVKATGGQQGAGIGGGQNASDGTVKINGGIVEATGGCQGAGIGGGYEGSGGTVTINGGTVIAKGTTDDGAGIGGGGGASGGTTTINGGTVTATGANNGAGIGGGGDASGGYIGDSGTVTISGGSVNADVQATPTNGSANGDSAVYLARVMLDGVNAVTLVTSLSTSAGYYGTNNMYTDDSGYLYIWLPDKTNIVMAETAEHTYGGNVSVSSSNTASGVLSLVTKKYEYLDVDGVTKTVAAMEITGSTTSLCNGWYVVDSDVTLSSALTVSSDVKLILADGCTLTVTAQYSDAGINVAYGNCLTVYCQSAGTGKLIAQGARGGAGIGGGSGYNKIQGFGGSVTINGGTVTATGNGGGAGIGGGWEGKCGTVTISGGTVTATSYGGGVGIGGGKDCSSSIYGTMIIDGGSVNADIEVSPTNGSTNGSNKVYLAKVQLEGVDALTKVKTLTADTTYSYGTKDLYTDASGYLYLWLPDAVTVTAASTAAQAYKGSVTASAEGSVTGILHIISAVKSMTPSGTGVPISGNIGITFSEAMDTTAGTVSLDGGSTSLSGGSWSADDKTYTVPYSGLSYSTPYTISICGFKDATGNVMEDDSSRSFTTADASDTTPPTVTTVMPNGTGTALTGNIVITFSEAMDTTAGSVSLDGGSTSLSGGSWSADDKTYTVPYTGLSYNTPYTVTISGFRDVAGNSMTTDRSRSFTTTDASDTTPPTVTTVTPRGTGTVLTGNIVITFSEAMDTTAGMVSLDGGSTSLSGGSWSADDKTYTVPYSGLSYSTPYTISISGFRDAAGNALEDDSSRSFTTADASDTTPPTVTTVMPRGTGTALTGNIAITFSEAMDTMAGSVSLDGGSTSLSGGNWSADNKTYTVPYSGISYSTPYTISISGFKDAAGNVMEDDSSRGFTTVVQPSHGGGGGSTTASCSVTATQSTGGKIALSASSVAEGTAVTVTITPESEYSIADVFVNGVSIGTVSSYTFTVTKDTAVSATFTKRDETGNSMPDSWQNPFSDVLPDAWYYDAVKFTTESGLFMGTSKESFSPESEISRAMIVTVLYRLSGDNGSYTNTFVDVPSGAWYENSTAWALANSIISGVGDNKFAPDAGVTREQFAVMLYNYAKYKGCDVSVGAKTNIQSFKDVSDISDYAYTAMQWACGAEIINGNNGYLNPQGFATRAEVAVMLQKFIKNVID